MLSFLIHFSLNILTVVMPINKGAVSLQKIVKNLMSKLLSLPLEGKISL